MFFHCESYFIQTVPPLSDIGRPTVQINISPYGSHKQRCVQKSSAQDGLCFVERQTIVTHVLKLFTLIIQSKENLTKLIFTKFGHERRYEKNGNSIKFPLSGC